MSEPGLSSTIARTAGDARDAEPRASSRRMPGDAHTALSPLDDIRAELTRDPALRWRETSEAFERHFRADRERLRKRRLRLRTAAEDPLLAGVTATAVGFAAPRPTGPAASPPAPRLSFLLPLLGSGGLSLRRLLHSFAGQPDLAWQLCAYAAGPAPPVDLALLSSLAQLDPRIRVARHPDPADSASAINRALAIATAEFVVLLASPGELNRDAVATLAQAIDSAPDGDVLYSDEDTIDPIGQHWRPILKPGWSPDLLLSCMYLGNLLVIRRSLLEQLGGLRPEFGEGSLYDLALRVSEVTDRITHVPAVLFHRHPQESPPCHAPSRGPSTNAAHGNALDVWPNAERDARLDPRLDVELGAALRAAVARRAVSATVESGLLPRTFRVRWSVDSTPLVSVIIPFRDRAADLERAVESIVSLGGWQHVEILLVDNQSWEPETELLTNDLSMRLPCRRLEYRGEFNWSAINNWAAERARGEILLFLNSDAIGLSAGWLLAMLEHALRPGIGAVGAQLRLPDGRSGHAGCVLRRHPTRPIRPVQVRGYPHLEARIRNVSAVTGACLMIRRELFRQVGGFDLDLGWNYNDVDFCLRLIERGYRCIYTPFAELEHEEGTTRGGLGDDFSTQLMQRRWSAQLANDPLWHPELSEYDVIFDANAPDPTEDPNE